MWLNVVKLVNVFFKDGVNILVNKAKDCDGFIFGTPVYYAHPSGRILDVLNRAFLFWIKVFCA